MHRNYSVTNEQKFRTRLNVFTWILLLAEKKKVYSGFNSVISDLFNE